MKSKIYTNTWHNPTKEELADSGITATIAFDLDSVLAEAPYLEVGVCEKFGVPNCRVYHQDGYRMFNYFVAGVSKSEITAAVKDLIISEGPSALPTPYMAGVLRYIHEVTHQPITVITHRSFDTMEVTHKWLAENMAKDVPFNLIMTEGPKEIILKRIGTQVFVDDRYKTVYRMQRLMKGITVLYKRPWNQGRRVAAGDMTINDLRDLIPFVNFVVSKSVGDWPVDVPYPNRQVSMWSAGLHHSQIT